MTVNARGPVTLTATQSGRVRVAAKVCVTDGADGFCGTVAPDGTTRINKRYLLVGRNGAARPDPAQAAWLYAQMVRWGQAPLTDAMLATAKAVFRPDLYDAALDTKDGDGKGEPADGIGAFAGPAFDTNDIAGHLAAWKIRRA